MESNSVDSIVTDPPYELAFMGKKWDATGIAYNVELWAECLRVTKPGGVLLAFGGTRTFHRMARAIVDAGWELEDTLHWTYGSGFPKSLDISKAIDKAAGVEGDVVGKRTFGKTSTGQGSGWNANAVAATGEQVVRAPSTATAQQWSGWGTALKPSHEPIVVARKPLSENTGDECSVNLVERNTLGEILYFKKANKKERPSVNGVTHATVKPLALMRHLVSISTPEVGVVLDPFAGSGTTMEAALVEGRSAIGIELTPEHEALIQFRMDKHDVEIDIYDYL